MGSLLQQYYGPGSINHKLFMFLNHESSPLLDRLMPYVGMLGSTYALVAYISALVVLCMLNRDTMPPRYIVVYVIAVGLSMAFEHYLKDIIQIPRPAAAIGAQQIRLLEEANLRNAFPSGHAVIAFVTARTLGQGRSAFPKVVLYLLAFAVAYSRIYVGAHYPLDVVAGAIIGMCAGSFVWSVYGFFERRHSGNR